MMSRTIGRWRLADYLGLVVWVATVVACLALIGMGIRAGETISRESETCFKSGEREAGLNKICYYSCPSGDAAITIKSTQLCPLSIHR